jgi:hypothetical protein
MNKNLVNSEKEFMKLFSKFHCEDLEEFLEIEFAFKDGKYQSDLWRDDTIDEDQDIDLAVYRKRSEDFFPDHYPCLVLWASEKSFDRTGSVEFQMLEFVYREDFNG